MKLLLKLLFIALLIPLAAIGAENREAGTATLYLLEQGKPVAGAEAIFDGSRTMVTDMHTSKKCNSNFVTFCIIS
jgi:hypothetical protein